MDDRPHSVRAADAFPDGSITDISQAPRDTWIPAAAFERSVLRSVLGDGEWQVSGGYLRLPSGVAG